MTITEARNILDDYAEKISGHTANEIAEAFDVVFSMMSAIDKIKAEIAEEKELAYADFGRYKIEYLGADSEYVDDELPDDDFRYGMERCIQIIDKHLSQKKKE